MKRTHFSIFYSWQSDVNSIRNSIENSIKKAIKKVKTEKQDITIKFDKDTRGKTGSPNIATTIFDKIEAADIFICDVSIINREESNKNGDTSNKRITPNPNVLIELGYAIGKLGWERIICLNNAKLSKTEELPFDIRGHRIITFDDKEKLEPILKSAIRDIIDNFEKISYNHSKSSIKNHDKEVFLKFEDILSENELQQGISHAVNSLSTSDYYYHMWDKSIQFYEASLNHFIHVNIHNHMTDFLKELSQFSHLCSKHFQYEKRGNIRHSNENLTEEEKQQFEQNEVYRIVKDPLRNETYEQAYERIYRCQELLYEKGEKVKSSYIQLVYELKNSVLI